MAWVETRITRTTQPQDAAGIDGSNPKIFTGLPGEFAWLPQFGGTPTLGSGATQTRVVSSVGSALEFAGGGVGAANHLSVGTVQAGTVSEYTFVLVVTRTATPTAYSQLALSCDVGGDGKPLVMLDDPDNTNLIFVKTSAGDLISTGLLYNAFGSDPQCLVVSMIGGSKLTAVQRNLRTGAVNTFDGSMGGGAWTLSAGNAVVGGRAYGQYAMQANIRRYFSLQAQLQLSQNPWQIFEPEVSRIWVDDYVSSGAVTGNASGSLSAIGLSPVSGTASGAASASAAILAVSLSAVNGTASGAGMASGVFAPISLSPVTGTANGETVVTGNASGAFDDVALSPVLGTANGAAVATGALSAISLTAINGTASGEAVVAGNAAGAFDDVSLTSITGVASGGSATGVRYWNGTTWEYGTLRYWSGIAWATGILRYWDGTNWSTP